MAMTPEFDESPLYDRIFIASAGTVTDYSLFVTPKGNQDPNQGSGSKTFADTMMTKSGQLPSPESFDVFGIALVWNAASNAAIANADMYEVADTGWFELRTQGDQYVAWRAPLRVITGGTGLAAAGTNTTSLGLGYAAPSAIQKLARPVTINEGESFSCHVIFSTAPTVTANVFVTCLLYGVHWLVRRAGQLAGAA